MNGFCLSYSLENCIPVKQQSSPKPLGATVTHCLSCSLPRPVLDLPFTVLTHASLPQSCCSFFCSRPFSFCVRSAVIFLSLSDATLFPLGFTCKPISNESVRYLLCVSKMVLFFFFFFLQTN